MEETTNYTTEEPKIEKEETCKSNGKRCKWCRIIIDSVLFAAIIVLFILHFCCPSGKNNNKETQEFASGHGNGEIVFVNIDSINNNYKLVDILTKDIEAENAKQEAIFTNRQKTLENKYQQFQSNYQSGILSQVQIENAQIQLQKESESLQADYQQVFGDLQARQSAALQQIADSLIKAAKVVNATRNASFVFTYQYGGQLISADPSCDITKDVLKELNKNFEK